MPAKGGAGASRCGDGGDWRHLSARAGKGCLNVGDLAQKGLAVIRFLAPKDRRPELQWAPAQADNDRPASSFDAFGDRDLTLPRE
jgi:hypothetical protein